LTADFGRQAKLEDVMSQMIRLSDRAAARVAGLLEEEGGSSLRLRVFVTGGGCSGFSYGFTFDDQLAEDDAIIVNAGVEMVVDELSYQYLAGAVVDFREDLQGSRFLVENPNAESTCGCGNSFSIAT
jgi:iron-sulfur cluster insertion protein